MEARQDLIHESLRKSVHALNLPGLKLPEIAPLREELEQALRTVEELKAVQYSITNRRTGSGPEIAKLRTEIGKRLRQISNTGIVCLDGLPGIKDELRPPRMNLSNAALLDGTARVIRNARPHLDTLHSHGVPQDTIERLEALAREMAERASAPNASLAQRSLATNAIPRALRRGRDIIRAIDSSMKVLLADDRPLMQVWEKAKRIPGKPGRPKKKRGRGGPDKD